MPGSELCNDSIAAVIVAYHPGVGQLQSLLQALTPPIGHVIVVNNGPAIELPALNSTLQYMLIESGSNIGVAAAINRGIDAAVEVGARYVLLLDQDSLPGVAMVQRLFVVCRLLEAGGGRAAAVGPAVVDQESGRVAPFVCASRQIVGEGVMVCQVDRLLTSGSFIDLKRYRQIGPMDEGLFIDLVDTEWFLRAASMGYQAYGVPSAQLYHQLGNGAVTYWCGRRRFLPRHGAFRYYYMVRNRILLLARPYIPVAQRLQEFFLLLYLPIVGLILLPRRWMRFLMIVQGIVDGVRGRTGKGPFSHQGAP